jgi:hypothetical protein
MVSASNDEIIAVDHVMVVYRIWRVYNPLAHNYSQKAFVKEMQEQTVLRCDYGRVQWLHVRARCFQNIHFRIYDEKLPFQIRVAVQKMDAV